MIVKIKDIDFNTGKREIFLNYEDSKRLGVLPGSRVLVSKKNYKKLFFVSISYSQIPIGEAIVTSESGLKKGEEVEIINAPPLQSIESIKKKIYGEKLDYEDIKNIINDIVEDNLSHIELSSYVTAIQTLDMDDDEIVNVINAMVSTGEIIKFDYDVYDVHSI
ncbi:MAG: thymidine phosphorylase, partial [Thermoplasmata archaeon]